MKDYLKQALKIYEVEVQLENDCVDENREMDSFTLEEVGKSVKYCIERMEMDLDEEQGEEEEIKDTIRKCKNWLNKYNIR